MKQILGDLHGQPESLQKILMNIDFMDKKFVFLGDYVDRGFWSLEVVLSIALLKVLFLLWLLALSEHVFLT